MISCISLTLKTAFKKHYKELKVNSQARRKHSQIMYLDKIPTSE